MFDVEHTAQNYEANHVPNLSSFRGPFQAAMVANDPEEPSNPKQPATAQSLDTALLATYAEK
jgi:hypothetical protein